MISRMYSIFDSAVDAFNQPVYARSDKEFIRMLEQAARSDKSFQANPRDYVAYHVGEFNDSSGLLVPLKEPRRLMSIAECLAALNDRPAA